MQERIVGNLQTVEEYIERCENYWYHQQQLEMVTKARKLPEFRDDIINAMRKMYQKD